MKNKINNIETEKLIIDLLNNELTDIETRDLMCWINESDENKKYFEKIRSVWIASFVAQNQNDYNSEDAWLRMEKRLFVKKSKLGYAIWMVTKVAAVFIIAFLLGFLVKNNNNIFSNYFSKIQSDTIEINVPKGAKSFIKLTDGTCIWINSGSTIKYTRDYNQRNRNIFLHGEAYFKVAKNKNLPFIVNAKQVNIKALGTSFNVKAYDEESKIEATLEEGKIEINNKYENNNINTVKSIILKPNQKATLYLNGTSNNGLKNVVEEMNTVEKVEVIKNVETKESTSWKDEYWLVSNLTFFEFSKLLERRYNVKFKFAEQEIQNIHFTGKFKDETLEEVLRILKFTAPINFKVDNGVVLITKNKNIFKRSKGL